MAEVTVEEWAREALDLLKDIDEHGFNILQPSKEIQALIAQYPEEDSDESA